MSACMGEGAGPGQQQVDAPRLGVVANLPSRLPVRTHLSPVFINQTEVHTLRMRRAKFTTLYFASLTSFVVGMWPFLLDKKQGWIRDLPAVDPAQPNL